MHNDQRTMPDLGTISAFTYKTGQYVGEVVENTGPRAVMKVLAVLKHPEQGDLHHPYNPDVPMFHERRALSYTEKANVPLGDIKAFHGEVPAYKASLEHALAKEIDALDKLKRWSERGLEQLEQLAKEYK
ncbi:kinase-associated lipoprotein B [Paenibacillus sp. R14(2021)]|uniref:kinase-associated lipoprotein B n=1 Tax=Paenibacillus sp. R14(2021) TaxID=2859228 RepID=UPI001C61333A|nr:kinase-associated lipoprotein B [Paenibacillus sp. R14(2021)]